MAFTASTFTFDGISSENFGFVLYNINGKKHKDGLIGTKTSLQYDQIARKNKVLYYGTTQNEPLEFDIIFGVKEDNGRLDRFNLAAISGWLLGHHEYKYLTISQPDMENIRFKCMITKLESVEIGFHKVAFVASITCDSPFAYLLPTSDIISCSGTANYLYRNFSNINEYYCPKIQIVKPSGTTSLTIKNAEDGGRTFTLSNLSAASMTIDIDCNSQVMESSTGADLYEHCNFLFPKFLRGDNHLTISGSSTITIKNEFPYNVGF